MLFALDNYRANVIKYKVQNKFYLLLCIWIFWAHTKLIFNILHTTICNIFSVQV